MLEILRQMGANHFEDYIKRFPTRTDLLDFLIDILILFKDLVSRPVYPKDWCEMIMLKNSDTFLYIFLYILFLSKYVSLMCFSNSK